MRYFLGAAFAVACVASSAAPARADSEIGLLECRGTSQQFIVGSITTLQCLFRPSSGGAPQTYDAQIRRAGVDIGFNQATTIAWSVFAPNSASRGSLAGTYVGPSANATLGIGIGANVLWGGSNSTIALQPVSGQGQIGLGVAGGISAMELRAHERPRGKRYRAHRKHRR